jgi:60 kDa SS-A/Ro ribonucleoprotein
VKSNCHDSGTTQPGGAKKDAQQFSPPPSCAASADSIVIPFDDRPHEGRVDPGDTILSVAERLAQFGGGGTDCSVPIHEANTKYHNRRFAGVVLVSDTESWVYCGRAFAYGQHGATGVMTEWQEFVKNQMRLGGHDIPAPKLVCIDLQPYTTTQAPDRGDILNIAGFSDAVFSVVAAFLAEDTGRFVAEVEAVEL